MRKLFYLLILMGLSGCQHSEQQALEQLQQTRELHRLAHISRDAELLINTFSDDFRLVQDGQVAQPSREASLAQFQPYFDSVTFIAWDDIQPPVITLSADGKMASVIVTKHVRIVARDNNQAEPQETFFAWLETWQQQAGEWKITTLASTEQAPPS